MMEHGTIWIFLLSILIKFGQGNEWKCQTTNKCACFDEGNGFIFQCPPGYVTKLSLALIPQQYVQINCQDLNEYDLSMFPDVNVGDLDYFGMRSCPLPNNSFSSTLEKFNISNIKHIHLTEITTTNAIVTTINKELFKGLSMLESLSLSLSRIKFEKDFLNYLPNLIELRIEDIEINQIDDSIFCDIPKLYVLDLTRNSLSHITDGVFKNLPTLQRLSLWGNKLTSLNRYSFTGLRQLKSLELSNNKIVSLDSDTFAELIDLVIINLRSNNLRVVPSNIFKSNTALETVKIGNNPSLILSDYVFAYLPNLINVYIDSSKLESLPQHLFERSFNILDISLENNIIRELPENIFKDLFRLEKLNLGGNKIEVLPNAIFSSLENLKELNLEGNRLTGINKKLLKNTVSLNFLNLRDNKIATIHLHSLTSLTKLDLSYNQYGENAELLSPFTFCEELQELNLSHNAIDIFPEGIIDTKVKLTSLDLSYNKIESLRVSSTKYITKNIPML